MFTLLQINEEFRNRLRNDARRRELTRSEKAAVEAVTLLRGGNLQDPQAVARHALDEGLYEVVALVSTTDFTEFAKLTDNDGDPWAMSARVTLTKSKRLEAKKNAEIIRATLRQAGHPNPESITMNLRSAGVGDIALRNTTAYLRVSDAGWHAIQLEPREAARYAFDEAR